MKDRYFDNSRIEAYRKCERMFYFRHERDWETDTERAALSFGGAWHNGMDVIWTRYCSPNTQDKDPMAVVGDAMKAFEERWCGDGFPSTNEFAQLDSVAQDKFAARTPMTAMEMFYNYIDSRHRTMTSSYELLACEQPFAVPLDPKDPNLWYVGRLDKVVRRKSDGSIFAIEHKTTSAYKKDGYFRSDFIESFSPNSQIDGYIYAGKMTYGVKFRGVMVDAALVHKTVHDGFKYIPIERQLDQLESWLWQTHIRIKQIEDDRNKLLILRGGEADVTSPYLPAFPQKTEACTLYGNCQFMDLCKSGANPERWENAPNGFHVQKWSPFDELELSKIGMKEPSE